MLIFITRTTNSVFEVADDGSDFVDLDTAYKSGVKAALQIGAEEMIKGATVAMMEVCIENIKGKKLARGIVSLSSSRLSD